MRIVGISTDDGDLAIRWTDGEASRYPFIWLRDNDPSAFDPETQERVFDLLSVGIDIVPVDVTLGDDGASIKIIWPDRREECRFDAPWLWQNRPGRSPSAERIFHRQAWGSEMQSALPVFDAAEINAGYSAKRDFLTILTKYGIAIVSGLGTDPDAGIEFAKSIGPLRNSNFGITFDVMSKPLPNNLAYTSHYLPLHTDLPNQEIPPGFQFLHCILNEAEGGHSIFCDGLKISADLEHNDPDAFRLLRDTPIPYRFQDGTTDLINHRPVFALDDEGRVGMIIFNPHIAATFDMAADVMSRYYPAYRKMMAMTRHADYVIETKLKSSDMVIFDNRRVLHGRTQFDPQTGARHLRGCYVDHHDIASRLRVLERSD